MIRASDALSAAKAMDYFRQDYTLGDYYAAERRGQAGVWQGRGAERLGLTGRPAGIRLEEFEALLEGRSPIDGRQLVAPEAGTGKHRAAWDFVVSPDKSVSLVALLMPDPRVERAHIAAAGKAFEMLEQQALTKDRDRQLVATGNLVIARFDHDSSRALDPQLHSHHVIFNLTDRAGCAPGATPAKSAARGAGAEWRALETSGLYAAQRLATAIYHVDLARGLQALGYEVGANAKGQVGIPGFPKGALAAFSKRRKQILDELDRERDAGGTADPQRAALRTRREKIHDVDPEALRARWRAEAEQLGIDFAGLRQAADARLARGAAGGQPAAEEPLQQARVSVAWAVAHLGERQAAFRVMDLEDAALRHGAARGPGLDEIRAAVAGQPGLIDRGESAAETGELPSARLVTTEGELRLELHNLAQVRAGSLPSGRPILDRPYDGAGASLAPDQLNVVRHILESRESVLAVEGKPGTGKTYALTAVREAAAAGWSVEAFAVTTGAVAQLRAVGLEASTLKSLAGSSLARSGGRVRRARGGAARRGRPGAVPGDDGVARDGVSAGGDESAGSDRSSEGAGGGERGGWAAGAGSEPSRQLWIVDEAGLMSSRDAATALDNARRAGARLVFVGDRRQHHAVEAGKPWAVFQDKGGLRPVRLDAIRRQQDPELLRAVELSSEGRAGDAMRHLGARGHVIEIAGARRRHAAMVRELVGPPPAGGDPGGGGPDGGGAGEAQSLRDTLMIAPSHAERRALNALARRELVKRGVVAAGGVSVEIAVGKGVTSAERTDPRHYEEGDVVTYDRAAPSHRFMAGDSARVVAVDAEKHTVTVKRQRDGETVEYDPRRLRGGDLARVESRELAAGDRVQFRRADRTRSIANGATATVRETAPGRLVLELDGAPGGKAGRTVTLEPGGAPLALDHAYAVTSHASQGSTVRRVLATFDTRHSAELVNRQQANVTLSRASHELTVYTDDRGRLPRAVDRQATKTSALDVHVRKPARRDHHADAPLSRDPSPTSWRADALSRAEQPDRDGRRQPAGRPGPAGGGAVDRSGRGAELAAAPGSGAGARPGSRADRAQRPRDPLPVPGAERTAGEKPRPRGAAHGDGGRGGAAERGSAVRLGGGALDAGDARRGLPAGDGARSAAAPPPPTLIVRLVAAAERWYGSEAGRGAAGKAAEAGGEKAAGARPQRGRASLGGGGRAGVAPWRAALAAPAPLHHMRHPRAAGAALSALHRLGDAERQLVRLVKRIGPARALALLPPMLARAVRGLRAVARLLAGPERGR